MANTNLAGEKSDVKIQHASIASGNLSLITSSHKKKSILGKKKNRPESTNAQDKVKTENNNDDLNKSDKSK